MQPIQEMGVCLRKALTGIGKYKFSPAAFAGAFGVVRFAYNDNKCYAVKIYGKPLQNSSESDCLKAIAKKGNQHIVGWIQFKQDVIVESKYLKSPTNTSILVMEGIRGHEIFDYLRKSRFSEEIAWYLFHQLINGLEAIHSTEYVHRDIKIENLMITVNAQGEPILKIIDFGHSIKIEKNKKYQPAGGTPYINDPCFYKEDLPYNPFKADIFSAGVVLLRMITNSNVFQKAEILDLNYKMVIMERWKQLWTQIESGLAAKPSLLTSSKTISPSLKNLLEKLLVYKASARFSLQQIKLDPWFTTKKQPNLKAFVDLKIIKQSQQSGKRSAQIQITSQYYQDNPKVDTSVLQKLWKQDEPHLVVDYGFEELYARIRWFTENDETRMYGLSVEEGEGLVTILVKVGEKRMEEQVEEKEEEGKVEPEIQIQLFKDHDGKRLALYFTRNKQLESLTFYEIKDDIMMLL